MCYASPINKCYSILDGLDCDLMRILIIITWHLSTTSQPYRSRLLSQVCKHVSPGHQYSGNYSAAERSSVRPVEFLYLVKSCIVECITSAPQIQSITYLPNIIESWDSALAPLLLEKSLHFEESKWNQGCKAQKSLFECTMSAILRFLIHALRFLIHARAHDLLLNQLSIDWN